MGGAVRSGLRRLCGKPRRSRALWRKPAPTLSRWVSGYGPSRTTPPRPSPRPPTAGIRPRASGGGGPRVAWWRGPLIHRFVVVAGHRRGPRPSHRTTRGPPSPLSRGGRHRPRAHRACVRPPRNGATQNRPPRPAGAISCRKPCSPAQPGGQKPDLAFGASPARLLPHRAAIRHRWRRPMAIRHR